MLRIHLFFLGGGYSRLIIWECMFLQGVKHNHIYTGIDIEEHILCLLCMSLLPNVHDVHNRHIVVD